MALDVILKTRCGSHAWGMERPDSDIDYFTVYRTPTRDILRSPSGERGHSIRNKQDEYDDMKHEVGFIAHMVTSGNINFVTGVMSPATEISTPEMTALRNILTKYPCKGIYHSCMGLSKSNFHKYILMRLEDTPKKRALIMRTLRFAIRAIEDGVYDFRVVKLGDTFTVEEMGDTFLKLKKAYEASTLRETYPKDLIQDWLLDVRLKDLDANR